MRLVLRAKDSNDNMAVAKGDKKRQSKKLTIKPQGRRCLVLFNVTYLKEFESKRQRELGNSPVHVSVFCISVSWIL